jgi:hypothetical protein
MMFPRDVTSDGYERDDRQLPPITTLPDWVRLSPICSFENEEDDDDDDRHTPVYHRALQHRSLTNGSSTPPESDPDRIHPALGYSAGGTKNDKNDTAYCY